MATANLKRRFEKAQEDVQALRPDNDTKLQLYALYKQATLGDVQGDPPGPFDFVGRAKFDAWKQVEGVSKEDAMKQYADLVASLIA